MRDARVAGRLGAMTEPAPDRLRQLLDAVLDEEHRTLDEMAGAAHSSRFHFARTVSEQAGEAPAAMRRRVMLERAAWRLRNGAGVLEAGLEAGYESAEGFSRAFARAYGVPPSDLGEAHWLPSTNGIHFHPPSALWVTDQPVRVNPMVEQMLLHDVADTSALIRFAASLPADEVERVIVPNTDPHEWSPPEASAMTTLVQIVRAKRVWLAAIEGDVTPEPFPFGSFAELAREHDAVAERWLSRVRAIDARGGWDDRFIDALCEPPESFQLSSVVAHVLHYSAYRREVARSLLSEFGLSRAGGDPILWVRERRGERSAASEHL